MSTPVNTLFLLLGLALLLVNPVATQAAPPQADAGQDRDMMAGGNITLQGLANDPDGDPIIGWHWELDASGDGSPPSITGATTPNPTFTAASPGVYVLTLVVDNGVESSEPDFTIITVANNQQPVAVAEADQTSGPSPLTVNFNGIESTEPDFQELTFYWYFGDGDYGEGPRVTHQYSIPGTYLVTLTVTDDRGAVDLATLEIMVTENDTPPAVDAVPDNSAAAEMRVVEADTSRVADAVATRDILVDESAASENATTSGRINNDLFGLTVPVTDPAPGSVQFGAASYSVVEDGTNALLWVTRTGDSTAPISVDYATDDFTATAGNDYTTTSGTLSFAEGVIMQSVRVPILNDSTHENNESFVLFLYNVTDGVGLEAQRVAFVSIIDNDAVALDPAPVTDPAPTPDPVPALGIVVNTQCATTSSSGFTRREQYRERNVFWTINLLSSADKADVDALAMRVESMNIQTVIQEAEIDGTRYWRLQITAFNSRSDAEESSAIIKETLGIDNAWIFRQKQPDNTAVSDCSIRPPSKASESSACWGTARCWPSRNLHTSKFIFRSQL